MTHMFPTWRICTSPVLALIILVSYGHTETFDFTKCEIRDNFKSDLVAASFKTLDAGLGCETNATSSAGQEVHVIHMNLPAADNEKRVTVKLSIHSRSHANLEVTEGVNFREEPQPVIFVLHSSQPVTWVIEMFGLNNQQKHLFMLSHKSSVRFQQKRARRLAKVRKRTLPFSSDNTTIYYWAQKRFGAVTSFSRISEPNVKFYIGRDVSANTTCDPNALSLSLRIFSFSEAVKLITGCVSKRRNQHVLAKPVYIIELLEPPDPSPGVVGVDLEIMPYYSGASMRSQGEDLDEDDDWQFYLVVKSPPSLQWTLHSKKIVGYVDIVADANTDVKVTGVKISTVALRADEIKVTGKQLIEWSQDYIAPVQMYAGVHAANTIKLKVPPLQKDMASAADHSTSSDNNRHGLKVPREGELNSDHEYGETGHDESPDGLIQVSCTDQVMEVAIAKHFFQVTGLGKTRVSLMDPSCGFTAETDDLVILCTELMHCGTSSQDLDDMMLYTNAVLIHTTPSLGSMHSPMESGSGLFEGDSSSGTPDHNLTADDEDYQPSPLSIPVECMRPAMNQLSNDSHNTTSDVNNHLCRRKESQTTATCSLSLYQSATFFQPEMVKFPAKIARNSTVYIKAAIDHDITILVDSCWFSTSSEPDDKMGQIKMVVSHGCSRDDTLSWLNHDPEIPAGGNLQTSKLKVMISDVFFKGQGQSYSYLHCQFQLCQRGESSQADTCTSDGHVQCHELDQQDVDSAPHGPLPSSGCGPLSVGPFHLVDNESLTKLPSATDISTTSTNKSQDSHNQGQEQRVIIEGLDSATVVVIAFAAFVIGILLIGTLWFIHSHTGPTKRAVPSPREPEAGSVTDPNPSSQPTV